MTIRHALTCLHSGNTWLLVWLHNTELEGCKLLSMFDSLVYVLERKAIQLELVEVQKPCFDHSNQLAWNLSCAHEGTANLYLLPPEKSCMVSNCM